MTTVRLRSMEELGRALARDLRGITRKAKRAAFKTADDGILTVAQRAPTEMKGDVVAKPIRGGGRIRVQNPGATAVEVGARAHIPPFLPILRWVKRKGIGADDPVKAARAIQFALKDKNLPPKWFVAASIPDVIALLDANMHAALSGPPDVNDPVRTIGNDQDAEDFVNSAGVSE